MQEIVIMTDALKGLLKRTQRNATINGKVIPQVEGTTIKAENGYAQTCNIVRDGITSISQFTAQCPMQTSSNTIVVANISLMLGALSKHKGSVRLTQEDGKIKIVSKAKQTTLISSEDAKAFTHTKKTVKEWSKDSNERFINAIMKNEGKYTSSTGGIIEPFSELTVDVAKILDAMDSASMNGQKVSHYDFSCSSDSILWLSAGDEIKGRTRTALCHTSKQFATVIGGSLENVLRTMTGAVDMQFFDLTPLGGGISLLISQGGLQDTVIFQREVANAN